MHDESGDVELSRDEEELLRSLNRELVPPPDLEARIVAALRRRKLVRASSRRRGISLRPWQALAAALGMAVAGFLIGRWPAGEPEAPLPERSRFVLLLYEDPDTVTTEEVARRQFEEYASWAEDLRRRGAFEAGAPIAAAGHVLRQVDGQVQETQGLGHEGREVLSGYFLIRARDAQEALRTARECPHLRYDGTVAVRPVGEP